MPTMTPLEPRSSQPSILRRFTPELLLALAGLYWAFQIAWFWRYCAHTINIDAISYIGIARHVAQGDFKASFHGYWSPLISWLIAAVSFAGGDRTLGPRLLMLPTFAACMVLAYWLTQKLWDSRLLSAAAVLWFTAARGVAAFSVSFIGADLLLTAVVLLYFIVLLGCLEHPENPRKWFALGGAHAVAFLVKAIAMPLFALATLAAVLSTLGKNPRKAAANLAFAAICPALIWVSWGTALHSKYGVFTTGYQLRWNLLDPAVRGAIDHSRGLTVLHDTRSTYDSFMVTDAMPPGSRFWQAKVRRPTLLSQIVRKERENIPEALKQLMVLLTPGGVLAVLLCLAQLTRGRQDCPARFRFVGIVCFTVVALLLAYCMLVFDGRYVLPLTPLLMALGIRFALPPDRIEPSAPMVESVTGAGRWQTAICALLIAGVIGTQVYWASPFRTIRQDYQRSVYDAAETLRQGHVESVVAIGEGPYPEHGVGWEASVYAAYFAESRIVAQQFEAQPALDPDSMAADVEKLAPDAVMIWSSPSDSKYSVLRTSIQAAYPGSTTSSIRDPQKGEVGTVLLLTRKP